jgi:hypothetical protein
VLLNEQKRVHDEVWYQFLQHLRNGNVGIVTPEDILMLRSLVLLPVNTIIDELPWRDAFLITPQHAVQVEWNKKAVQKLCKREKQQLFICPAKDRIGERTLSAEERIHVHSSHSLKGRKRLADEIEVAIGMKALVMYNLETELDITNRARGTTTDIMTQENHVKVSCLFAGYNICQNTSSSGLNEQRYLISLIWTTTSFP